MTQEGAEATELPPRARRIRTGNLGGLTEGGTTSACAENTRGNAERHPTTGNYLRVRGEYPENNPIARGNTELPPRARRIRWPFPVTHRLERTTSACAENTQL